MGGYLVHIGVIRCTRDFSENTIFKTLLPLQLLFVICKKRLKFNIMANGLPKIEI